MLMREQSMWSIRTFASWATWCSTCGIAAGRQLDHRRLHHGAAFISLLPLSGFYSQDAFYENYFESQRDHIFRSVELLIYVFDIESRELDVRISLSNAYLPFEYFTIECAIVERPGAL